MKVSIIRAKLKKLILGKVLWDKEILDYYSVDSSSYKIRPKVIVIPKNRRDVISVVKFAKKNKISVTPRGAGTGLVGSAIGDGIIVDLKEFNSIKISKNHVSVGMGTSKGKLDKELEQNKKLLGPNPSVGPYCTIGGMIGTNASGSRSLKYGSIIDNLLEVEFIDGVGNHIKLPSKNSSSSKILKICENVKRNTYPLVTKNSCGYRLDTISNINETQKILAGSEGTLGIIISAKLRIFDIPKKQCIFIISYDSVGDASIDCEKIIRVDPSAVEFVDEITLKNIEYHVPKKTKCLLFVEIDSDIQRKEKAIKKMINGKIIDVSKSQKIIRKWWKYRDSALSYSMRNILKDEKSPHIIEDAAVPIKHLRYLFSVIDKIQKQFDVRTITYGHAGNGNIHVRLITKQSKGSIKKIAKTYFSKVIKIGGTITGEHGDGLARSEFVKLQYDKQTYLEFQRLKKSFDPKNILNPNKIISEKSTIVDKIDW